jgi:hypothetical protein
VGQQRIDDDLGAGYRDGAFGRTGRGRRISLHTLPFLINASGLYHQKPFGHSGGLRLFSALRAINRS